MFKPEFKIITFTPEVVTVAANLLYSATVDVLPENTLEGARAASKLLKNSLMQFMKYPSSENMLLALKHAMIIGYLQALQDNKLLSIPKDEKLITMEEARTFIDVNLPPKSEA